VEEVEDTLREIGVAWSANENQLMMIDDGVPGCYAPM
jgi:hypothetical protein